jgi:hypothetical protein
VRPLSLVRPPLVQTPTMVCPYSLGVPPSLKNFSSLVCPSPSHAHSLSNCTLNPRMHPSPLECALDARMRPYLNVCAQLHGSTLLFKPCTLLAQVANAFSLVCPPPLKNAPKCSKTSSSLLFTSFSSPKSFK